MTSPYILGAIALGSIAIVGGSYGIGHHAGTTAQEAKMEKAIIEATQKAAAAQKTQDAISLKSAVDAAQHQIEIHTVTQTITKRIPVYVAKTDACPVSSNYVRLWNDAVAGTDSFSATAAKPNVAAGSNAISH